MKIKITRADGTIVEAEGTAEECERLASGAPAAAPVPWPSVQPWETAPSWPYRFTPYQPYTIQPYVWPYYTTICLDTSGMAGTSCDGIVLTTGTVS